MPNTIAIQGELGSFSDAAARKLLGAEVTLLPCRSFDEVFDAVSAGSATGAVVPIENSLAGSVLRTYELLATGNVRISGETLLPIRMDVIGTPGARLAEVRRILSHPVALAQCHRFLAAHAELEAVATYDTAGSVKIVMDACDPSQAAIAGAHAADLYGAEILVPSVQDHDENFTRFLLLAASGAVTPRTEQSSTAAMKTTLLFRTPNKPGALFRALAAFALRDINLTKLESRPIAGRPWEYMFYADIVGDEDDANVSNALNHLREMCETMIVLGSYPASC